MKQGQASTSKMGSTKVEPVSHGVNPGAVSRLGTIVAPGTKVEQMYEGRGLKAPMAKCTTYPKGSQK